MIIDGKNFKGLCCCEASQFMLRRLRHHWDSWSSQWLPIEGSKPYTCRCVQDHTLIEADGRIELLSEYPVCAL